jgi:hypothetical protein
LSREKQVTEAPELQYNALENVVTAPSFLKLQPIKIVPILLKETR